MVHQLNIDGQGNVVLENGSVIGSYRVVASTEKGGVVAEFEINDEFAVKQLTAGVINNLSTHHMEPFDFFD